jgi:hypothetical protein
LFFLDLTFSVGAAGASVTGSGCSDFRAHELHDAFLDEVAEPTGRVLSLDVLLERRRNCYSSGYEFLRAPAVRLGNGGEAERASRNRGRGDPSNTRRVRRGECLRRSCPPSTRKPASYAGIV